MTGSLAPEITHPPRQPHTSHFLWLIRAWRWIGGAIAHAIDRKARINHNDGLVS
jgi:hypothetical protein